MNNRPKRGPKGPMGQGFPEQAKDFKMAIKRLAKELKSFHFLIILSLVLAALGSVLSILAPDKLSSLTDEISEGLTINKDNMILLSENIENSFSENTLKKDCLIF